MILVTGGTGFVGQALIRHLVESGYPVRTLVRPSPHSPNLPRGVAVEAAVASLSDARSLRAALVGVDTIYHLVTGEWKGPKASLMQIDIQGTSSLVAAASDAGVKRIYYVSHIGADRGSAYPVLKAKGVAEEFIRKSGIDYTILRTGILFGPNDGLTTGLARLLSAMPFFFLVPGSGRTVLQPLWVEDLVTCLTWANDLPDTLNRTIEIGGPEYLNFTQVLEQVMHTLQVRRSLVPVGPPFLRALTVTFESMFPRLPVSVYWLDYLAANRTCALDTLPRVFNLMPSRFSQRLAYLKGKNWRQALLKTLLARH